VEEDKNIPNDFVNILKSTAGIAGKTLEPDNNQEVDEEAVEEP